VACESLIKERATTSNKVGSMDVKVVGESLIKERATKLKILKRLSIDLVTCE
jgi:hypothetical protein